MGKKQGRMPSVLLVAVAALVAAVAGTALASDVATPSLSKKDKRAVKKIAKKKANKRITKREPRLDVRSATTADVADDVSSGAVATAFAYIDATGDVDESRSLNISDANVTGSSGHYCFNGLGFEPKVVTATPEGSNLGGTDAVAVARLTPDAADPGPDICPGTEEASVHTGNTAGSTFSIPVFVVFF